MALDSTTYREWRISWGIARGYLAKSPDAKTIRRFNMLNKARDFIDEETEKE